MRFFALSGVFVVAVCAWGQTPCTCDPARPETLKARECSLCTEAEKQPAGDHTFFLKDINPRKPNRNLALPRKHTDGLHPLADMNQVERAKLWRDAIARAKELWGDQWAVAYNGDLVRTQCHTHLHLGKLLPGVEAGTFIEVARVEDIPAPTGEGVWVHPVPGGKMHAHTGEQITETVLLR